MRWLIICFLIVLPGPSRVFGIQTSHSVPFAKECLEELAPPYVSVLGDLRRFAGRTVPFLDFLPHSPSLRVGYELLVRHTANTSAYERQLAHDLRECSDALEDAVEIAAVALEHAGQGVAVFYRSDAENSVSQESFLGAFSRLQRRVAGRAPYLRAIQRHRGRGLTVHRMHVHPAGYSAPHSAADVLGAVRRWKEFQETFGAGVQYHSHVLPLEYEGQLLFTFVPAEHRVY